MGKRIMVFYDKEGDVLDIAFGKPRTAISEEASDEIVVRKNPKTGEIVGFTVINF